MGAAPCSRNSSFGLTVGFTVQGFVVCGLGSTQSLACCTLLHPYLKGCIRHLWGFSFACPRGPVLGAPLCEHKRFLPRFRWFLPRWSSGLLLRPPVSVTSVRDRFPLLPHPQDAGILKESVEAPPTELEVVRPQLAQGWVEAEERTN